MHSSSTGTKSSRLAETPYLASFMDPDDKTRALKAFDEFAEAFN